jgi:hypothetical protein
VPPPNPPPVVLSPISAAGDPACGMRDSVSQAQCFLICGWTDCHYDEDGPLGVGYHLLLSKHDPAPPHLSILSTLCWTAWHRLSYPVNGYRMPVSTPSSGIL